MPADTFTPTQQKEIAKIVESTIGEFDFPIELSREDFDKHRDILSKAIIPEIQRKLDEPRGLNEQIREITEGLEGNVKKLLLNGAFPLERVQEIIDGSISKIRSGLRKDLLADLGASQPIRVVRVDGKQVDLGRQHCQFPFILSVLQARLNAFMVGPAGAGKTTLAVAAAKALGVPFYFTGAIASEYKLTGFIDAQGRIVSTEFRRAYEHGGLFLFDEIDASFPQAVLSFNAALANNFMDFPDKRVERHEDFYCIAAANTYGQGADRQYVGRNQLDAASLDRFAFVDIGYDEALERDLAGNDAWVDVVQAVRKKVDELKVRHVVSPRASIFGASLFSVGMDFEKVADIALVKGMDKATKTKIFGSAEVAKVVLASVKVLKKEGSDTPPRPKK